MKSLILMADIIDSSSYDQSRLALEFQNLISSCNEKFNNEILSPLTITLGDEFQGVIKDLKSAMNIIFHLEEEMISLTMAIRLRYSLKEGDIDTNLNHSIAHGMLGHGLTKARENLNNIRKNDLRFKIEIQNNALNEILSSAFEIYDEIIDSWNSAKDRILISTFLRQRDYKIVAKLLGKNRSLMWKRSKNLHMKSYEAIKQIIIWTTLK